MRVWLALTLVLASMTPCASFAAESGVYCATSGHASFAERIAPSGEMRFSVGGVNDRGHLITVSGVAKPTREGWRYQVKSDAVPDDRCTIDIKRAAGGFTLHTWPGASCVSSGGDGADATISDLRMPASARLADAKGEFEGDAILHTDCAAKPTKAGKPTFVGVWAEKAGNCKTTVGDGSQSPTRITQSSIEGWEYSCEIKKVSRAGDDFVARLSCASEGDVQSKTYRWQVSPDGRKLHETSKDGVFDYVRCEGR